MTDLNVLYRRIYDQLTSSAVFDDCYDNELFHLDDSPEYPVAQALIDALDALRLVSSGQVALELSEDIAASIAMLEAEADRRRAIYTSAEADE